MPSVHLTRTGTVRRHLWLKAVNTVNLDVHCARSLVGTYLRTSKPAIEQAFDLPDARAWYFCGVTEPYRWADNDHALLVAVDDPNETSEFVTPGYQLTLIGVESVPISPSWIPLDAPHASDRKFHTCRNWQAAWWLHTEMGLAREAGDSFGRPIATSSPRLF